MIAGRIWKFGDNISTDLIMPGHSVYLPGEERLRFVFQATRPGWAKNVRPGDLIVAGSNFGTGSSRPAPLSFRSLGIACLLADSITDLFYRNCVSFGLLALECPGVAQAFEEDQTAEVSLEDFTVRNRTTGRILQAARVPERLVQLMVGGGVFPLLESEGLIGPADLTEASPRSTRANPPPSVK